MIEKDINSPKLQNATLESTDLVKLAIRRSAP